MMEQPNYTRRDFLGSLAVAGGALSSGLMNAPAEARPRRVLPVEEAPTIHVFSKHLQFLDYEAMAEAAAEIGFDGVELTVRPGGHVLPENVATDLPQAVAAIRQAGLLAHMMATAVIDPQDTTNQTVLKVAGDQGLRYYRTRYLHYEEKADIASAISRFQQQLAALARLSEQYGLYASYQNHAGAHYVGAPVWDIAYLLRQIDHPHLGSQYDIRHATVEGGYSWPLGLQLIHPHINTLVVKDFRWEKIDGKWRVYNTPLGEGMVDFPAYFQRVKELGITAPISVHFEYEMPEEDDSLSEAEKRKQTIAVMRKDVETLRGYLSGAGLI